MPTTGKAAVHYIRRNFDEAAILAVAAKLAFEENPDFSESELATIAAMQRAHPQAGDSTEELGSWLSAMNDDQIQGVVNNTKGVLHEMEFVRLENDDGDAIHAALYGSTNHPGTDVQFVDIDSGVTWSAQLKATDDASYVQDWIDSHPDGEILVTSELAARMDLSPSGLSNEHLTARTEDVVNQLLEAGSESDLWDYFPALTVASIALVVWELWTRHCKGEITLSQFKWMTAKVSGLKAGKLALLSVAMMIPGINVVTGAGLVASLLFSAAHAVKAVTEAKRLP
jgi:hypothetical protein